MNLNNSGKRSLVCSEIFFALFLTFGLLVLFLPACGSTTESRQPIAEITTQTTGPLDEHRRLNTATATLIPTPTPTPLPHPAAFDEAFARGLIRLDPESGQWIVSVVRTADGGKQADGGQKADGGRQTVELILLPDTFDTHDDLRAKNPLAPYTVRALDENGRPVTLIWRPDAAEFRLAYTFPTLFEGVGTETPRLLQENLDAIPFIPIEDIQNGLAAQSVLLAMQEDGYQPFSENTRLGENRLRFELRNNGLKTADLTSLGNLDRSVNVNNHQTKVTPFFFKTQLPNGQEVMAYSIAILNPADPKNWSPDEFIVTFGVAQPEIDVKSLLNFFKTGSSFLLINRVFLYATNPNLDPNDPNTIVIPNPNNPDNPTLLDARDPFQSLLAQLLSIEGNDVRQLTTPEDGVFYFPSNMTYIDDLGTEQYGNIIEVPMHTRLTWKIQTMGPFLFEVGVAQ
ncbi:MAG: hypothetical protein QW840_04460 [Candidatus Bathyarchaeia archaeon]